MFASLVFVLTTLSAAELASRDAVICAETGFSRAAEARDLDAFLSFVDPGARFVANDIVRGHEAIAEMWSGTFKPDGTQMRWRPNKVAVTADGKLAISRGPFRSIRTDDEGKVIESWGNYISTWRLNDDGEWKVVFDTGGDYGMTPSENDRKVLASEPDCD